MTSITSLLLVSTVLCAVGGDEGQSSPRASKPRKIQLVQSAKKQEPTLSLAERIARLQSSLQSSEKQLKEFQYQLADPEGEYQKALAEFQSLDDNVKKLEKALKEAEKNSSTAEIGRLKEMHKTILQKHQLAKERFNLAIQERRSLEQKLKTLPEKIQQDRQALDELLGKGPKTPGVKSNKDDGDKKTPATKPNDTEQPKTQAKTETPPAVAVPPVAPPGAVGVPNPAPGAAPIVPILNKPAEDTKELKDAKKEVEKKQAAARQAKDKAQSIVKRLETLQKNIEVDQAMLQTVEKKVNLLKKEIDQLEKERRQAEAAGKENLEIALQMKISEAQDRLTKARDEEKELKDNLLKYQAERNEMQKDRRQAVRDVEHKSREADKAKQKVEELQNPFTIRNITQWSIDRGPILLAIVIGMILLRFLARLGSKQLVNMMTKSGKRFSVREAENRAQTLASIFGNIASMMIIGGGTLMILDTVGLPIVPLMGGVAVIGLAVAFGTQNLIRDYFTGFMILLEDQYGINDIIKIGDTGGRVEKITLRMTVIRDIEGVAHFIPHGTIATVSNMTHGWSVAMFEVGVAYKENADYVIQVLSGLGKEMRQDADYGPLILEDPDMLGVDKFNDSAIVIKFVIKTRPMKQWRIKRELLRRIKNRFDELGIEIPFPHRTIYHHHTGDTSKEGMSNSSTEKWVA